MYTDDVYTFSKDHSMHIVNVREARARISHLLDAVERGEEVIIQRQGKPVARLVATEPGQRQVCFPDRRAFRLRLPPCRESTTATARAVRDNERF